MLSVVFGFYAVTIHETNGRNLIFITSTVRLTTVTVDFILYYN